MLEYGILIVTSTFLTIYYSCYIYYESPSSPLSFPPPHNTIHLPQTIIITKYNYQTHFYCYLSIFGINMGLLGCSMTCLPLLHPSTISTSFPSFLPLNCHYPPHTIIYFQYTRFQEASSCQLNRLKSWY